VSELIAGRLRFALKAPPLVSQLSEIVRSIQWNIGSALTFLFQCLGKWRRTMPVLLWLLGVPLVVVVLLMLTQVI
jgi:hypothetical protein